ncbi:MULTISPECIES: amidase [Arthrobacter]|uniref:Amidase n=2 Tax=Arthrobacter TaxID=1663 RepID=A0ABU9KFT2_9MICC|nr:amidase [Arthrobacter sp. YJM1]MDP5225668.1 amidase [Arthrobacter sp. YJM1]
MNPATSTKPLQDLSVVELAQALRDGTVTATQAVTERLDRIERLNGRIGAIVSPGLSELRRDALDAAARADEAHARGELLGPLHGVPFTVKDTLAVAGLPATAGSTILAGYVPESTAPTVERILAAGAILLGKTNTSEFAVDIHAGNLLFGDTRNPLDLDRTPGGSTGGEAAAVAAGLSSFGIGTDLGGSIRWPAHCTGVVSMRPSIGLLPGTGALPYDVTSPIGPPNSASFLHRHMTVGPIARTVADVELLVRLMAGPDGVDSLCVPVAVPPSSEVRLNELDVAWCAGEGNVPVRADIVAVLARVAGLLAGSVKSVVEERPARLDEAAGLFIELRDAEGLPEVDAAVQAAQAQPGSGEITPGILSYLGAIRSSLSGRTAAEALASLFDATLRRDAVLASVTAFLDRHPVLLLPVASVTAPLIGTSSEEVEGTEVPWGQLASSCRAVSILDLPSVAVPVGHDAHGLPIGIQVVARRFHDHEALAVAREIERLAGFVQGPLAV